MYSVPKGDKIFNPGVTKCRNGRNDAFAIFDAFAADYKQLSVSLIKTHLACLNIRYN